MREVWTVRLGLVPYEEARAAQKALEARPARGRASRRAAAARAPARLHAGPPLDRRTSCRWARTGTGAGDRGARDRPRRARHLPRPGPAGRLPDRQPAALRRRRPRVRAAAGAGDDRGARRLGCRRPSVDRWPDRASGRRARAQDRLDRRPRQPRASPPTASRSTSTTTCSRSSGSSPAGSRAAG